MDATIIYLRDTGKAGKVEVSVECIGDPVQSLVLADSIMQELSSTDGVLLVTESIFVQPASDQLQ